MVLFGKRFFNAGVNYKNVGISWQREAAAIKSGCKPLLARRTPISAFFADIFMMEKIRITVDASKGSSAKGGGPL
jgi:hypothetical protein